MYNSIHLSDNYVTITFLAWEPHCHVSSTKCDWRMTHKSEVPRPSDAIIEKVYSIPIGTITHKNDLYIAGHFFGTPCIIRIQECWKSATRAN